MLTASSALPEAEPSQRGAVRSRRELCLAAATLPGRRRRSGGGPGLGGTARLRPAPCGPGQRWDVMGRACGSCFPQQLETPQLSRPRPGSAAQPRCPPGAVVCVCVPWSAPTPPCRAPPARHPAGAAAGARKCQPHTRGCGDTPSSRSVSPAPVHLPSSPSLLPPRSVRPRLRAGSRAGRAGLGAFLARSPPERAPVSRRRQQLARQGQPPDSHHVQVPARLQQQQQLGGPAPLHQRQGKAEPGAGHQPRGDAPPFLVWGGFRVCRGSSAGAVLWVTAAPLPLS